MRFRTAALIMSSLLMGGLSGEARASGTAAADLVFDTSLTMEAGEDNFYGAAVDLVNGYWYLVAYKSPTVVVKIRLATSTTPAARVGAVTFLSAENETYAYHQCIGIDPVRGYGYVSFSSSPGVITKFRLGDGDDAPTRVGNLVLEPGENSTYCIELDVAAGFGYAFCYEDPAVVVKFALGEGDAPPTRVSALTLNDANQTYPYPGAISPGTGKLWMTNYSIATAITQMSITPDSSAPTLDGTIDLTPAEAYAAYLRYDPISGALIHGGSDSILVNPQSVTKFRTGTGAALPQVIGSAHFPNTSSETNDLALDPASGTGYFLFYDASVRIAKIAFGGAFSGPGVTQIADVPTVDPGDLCSELAYDPRHRFLYVADITQTPGRVYIFRQTTLPDAVDLNATILKSGAKGKAAKRRVSAQVQVGNASSVEAGIFLVRLYLSSDPVLSSDDIQVGKDRIVKKLAPGKLRRASIAGTVTGPTAGKFLIAVADPQDIQQDANRGDNVALSAVLP